MAPVVYSIDASPPCRAILMLAKAIGVKLEVKDVHVVEGEHLQPSFLKMNPQHTVPTLDDNGFILWESHAISLYLIEKYGKVDELYSKDLRKKALINQRLHFDNGVAFALLVKIGKPIRLGQTKEISENSKAEVREMYGFLDTFLQGNKWSCGEKVTVADIHLASTISTIQIFEPITDKYPNVIRWLSNVKKEPWYEANLKGLNELNTLLTALLEA